MRRKRLRKDGILSPQSPLLAVKLAYKSPSGDTLWLLGSTKEFHFSVLNDKINQPIAAIWDEFGCVFVPRVFEEKPGITHCLVFSLL